MSNPSNIPRLLQNDKCYVFDIESFNNFFSVYFKNVVTGEYKAFLIHGETNMFESLINFIYSDEVEYLIGFNSLFYDDKMLSYMIENRVILHTYDSNYLTNILCKVSNHIIEGNRELRIRKSKWYKSVDLYKLLGFKRSNVSLKKAAVNMQWNTIQDLPFPPNSNIPTEAVNEVLKYNKLDVDVTEALAWKEKNEIKLREFMSDKFDMEMYNADRTYLGKMIFMQKFNAKVPPEYQIQFNDLRKWRTNRSQIPLKDVISDRWTFNRPEFNDILTTLKRTTVTIVDGKMRVWDDEAGKYTEFKHKATINNLELTIGLGGIHSNEKKIIIEADDDTFLCENDFSSYYPYLMVTLGICPEHFLPVKDAFVATIKELIDERMFWKYHSNPNEETEMNADALKISINSLFGLLGSKYFAFFDFASVLGVTINGQLGILKGMEMCLEKGISTYSANTDGFVTRTSMENKDLLEGIIAELSALVECECEVSPYSKMINKDVNNYIWQTSEGKIKQKGAFLKVEKRSLAQSTNHPIIVDAGNDYFLKGVDVEYTVNNCTDINKFTMTKRLGIEKSTGLPYKLWTVDASEYPVAEQQKTTRFYCSTEGYGLKRVGVNQSAYIVKDQPVTIFNTFIEKPFDEYKVDKNYYINQALKITQGYKTV